MKQVLDLNAMVRNIFGDKFTGKITVMCDRYGTDITCAKYQPTVFRLVLPNKSAVVYNSSSLGVGGVALHDGTFEVSYIKGNYVSTETKAIYAKPPQK